MPERPPSPLRGYGGQPPPVWRLRTVARRAIAGRAEVAKGGTRTPIAFRLPDPKSGASASSATFARLGPHSVTRHFVAATWTVWYHPPAPNAHDGFRTARSHRSLSRAVSLA